MVEPPSVGVELPNLDLIDLSASLRGMVVGLARLSGPDVGAGGGVWQGDRGSKGGGRGVCGVTLQLVVVRWYCYGYDYTQKDMIRDG